MIGIERVSDPAPQLQARLLIETCCDSAPGTDDGPTSESQFFMRGLFEEIPGCDTRPLPMRIARDGPTRW